MKKGIALILALALTLALTMVSADEKAKIGMCAASLSFDFQLKMSQGIERAAKEAGYEYVV